jgi:regulation of enolase protein 1 (concanavalin A-like superfamily)
MLQKYFVRSNAMYLVEKFLQHTIPAAFHWFNEPARYQTGAGLEIFTDEKTDFWQKTHYGFQRDDGHCLLTWQSGDFCLSTQVEYRTKERFDQCGLMVRGDRENWIKVSTEYDDGERSRLGSVVTNLGYSDWATQDVHASHTQMGYRVSKNGSDFLLESSFNGQEWAQLRIAHLHKAFDQLEIGVYACSPIGKDFWCRFNTLTISKNQWAFHE